MTLNATSHTPIYEQIVEHIRGGMVAGLYRADESLPSIRVLARELAVNPNTVQRAYQELERQGLVCTRRGLGVFVVANGDVFAQNRLEQAVLARCAEAIQLARGANMSTPRLEALFQQAMQNAGMRPSHASADTGNES